MKIAVSSSGKDLDSAIDPRFGRCSYFLVVATEDMSFEVINNESNSLGGGAGIQSAQLVSSIGADAVITGNCGPNAVKTLTAAGIKIFLSVTGTIKDAVKKYINGDLTPSYQANVLEYSGLSDTRKTKIGKQQPPAGRGGYGRAMGQRRGMNMGGRRGSGSGIGPVRGRNRL